MSATKSLKDTVYVDVDDEITSIIDKVEAAKQKIVALVLPKRAAVLQSIVNMRLLKRSAEKAGKNVVLITSESSILPLAGAVGMYTAKNLQSKPEIPPPPNSYLKQAAEEDDTPPEEIDETAKIDYNKPIGELAAASQLDDSPIDLDDDEQTASTAVKTPQPKKNKSLKVPNFEKFRLMILFGAAAIIGLIIFTILAIFVLPKAKITVKTASQPVSAHFRLTTSDTATELDEEAGIIPAAVKTADQESTQQVPATGQQNNGKKASGEVSMSAGACSANVPKDVPAGTGISSNGLTFITQEKTSFTAAITGGKCTFQSNGTTKVAAQESGTKYNIGPSDFSVAGRSGVSASSSSSMSGGTDDIVTVVSQQDIETAKQKITSSESDEFSKTFQKQLEETGFYVLESTLKLSEPITSTNPDVGQPASSVTVTIKITYTVLVVPKADLQKAVSNKLTEQIDTKKQKLSTEDVLEGIDIVIEDQTSPSKATLVISQDSTAIPQLDIAAIKFQVGGKKRSEIVNLVKQNPGVEDVKVDFSPFWVSKAPSKPAKITIKLEEVKSDASGN